MRPPSSPRLSEIAATSSSIRPLVHAAYSLATSLMCNVNNLLSVYTVTVVIFVLADTRFEYLRFAGFDGQWKSGWTNILT